MSTAKRHIQARLATSALLAIVLPIVLLYVYIERSNSLSRMCFLTGWVLFAAIATECARRFFRMRTGGNPARWVGQQTALAGSIVVLFGVHVEFSIPNGWLDGLLTVLFLFVTTTGAIGVLIWTQLGTGTIAATHATPEGEHDAALDSIERRADAISSRLGTLAPAGAFDELLGSFSRRPGFWRRVLWTSELARLLRCVASLRASTGTDQAILLDELAALAVEKDRLDALRVGDRVVRRWLLVHVPSVACLLALGSMHGVLSHAHSVLAHVLLGK